MWLSLSTCGASVKRGASVLGRWSSDGRQCWLWLGLGMLNRGREGLFELGQQLQQQGEYQAALHCFLSCLLGLTHVQSFTSLPNCLHQVRKLTKEHTQTHTHNQCCSSPFFFVSHTCMYIFITCIHKLCCIVYLHSCVDTFVSLIL